MYLPNEIVRLVGFERALILKYVWEHADSEGWCKLGAEEHKNDEDLSSVRITTIYRYLLKLREEGYLDYRYGCRTKSSSYKLTKVSTLMFKRIEDGE